MVHEMTRVAGTADFDGRQIAVARSIVRPLTSAELGAAVELVGPDGAVQTLAVQATETGQSAVTEPLARSGVYRLRVNGPSPVDAHYAVNVDTTESDLSRLHRAALASELMGDSEFTLVSDWQSATVPHADGGLSRFSLSRWFLLAALWLLLIEQLMAWRFAYGFAALYAVVSAALVVQAAQSHVAWAVLLALLLIAGLAAFLRRRLRSQAGR
jgi:hypothetical protein